MSAALADLKDEHELLSVWHGAPRFLFCPALLACDQSPHRPRGVLDTRRSAAPARSPALRVLCFMSNVQKPWMFRATTGGVQAPNRARSVPKRTSTMTLPDSRGELITEGTPAPTERPQESCVKRLVG